MSSEALPALHLLRAEVENIMRIQVVKIDTTGNVILIGGKNEQGKSSILNALTMLLGGKREFEEEPLRHGARRGRVFGDFGEFEAELTFTAKGTTALKVTRADGTPVASPQTMLNELCSKYTFDPLEIFRLGKEPDKQDKILREACGLDFSDLEREEEVATARRKEANAKAKTLNTLVGEAPRHPGVPAQLIDVAETVAIRDAKVADNEARKEELRLIESKKRELAQEDYEIAQLTERIQSMQAKLVEKQADRETLVAEIMTAERDVRPEEPIADLTLKLQTAEATNLKIRENAAYAELERKAREADEAADKAKDEVDAIKDKKAARLASMNFPVPGLTFTETGWRFQDVPLSQASQAQKLRLGVAFGCAMNPRIKIMFLRDGSNLDEDMLALLAQLAKENDCQVIIERVGKLDPGAIIIEDGMVASINEGSIAAAE